MRFKLETTNLIYAKDLDYFSQNRNHFRLNESGEGFDNPDNDPRGPWKADPFQVGGWRPNQQYEIKNPKTGEIYKPNVGCSWKNDYDQFQKLLKDNRIVFGSSGEAGPQRKRFLSKALERGKVVKTWWDDVGTTTHGTKTVKSLFGGKKVFSNPKPVDLIKKIVQLGDHTNEGIILDFFAGSSTTAHAVIELNKDNNSQRKFIMVQIPENLDPDNRDQVDMVEFCKDLNLPPNISTLSKERIRLAAKQNRKELNVDVNENPDLGFKVFRLSKSNFKIWEGNVEKIANIEEQLFDHVDNIKNDSTQEDILYELLLKSGFPLTVKTKKIQLAGKTVFSVEDGAMLICLDKEPTQDVIEAMANSKPRRVICLNEGFKNNDQLKANAVQLFKSCVQKEEREIVFSTV